MKEELSRLRKIEKKYLELKKTHKALLKRVRTQDKNSEEKISEGFRFAIDVGVYTEYCALNLEKFYKIIKKIPLKSIEFHLQRGDFERWLDLIEMPKLAKEVEKVRFSGFVGEDQRQKLLSAMEFCINT